jgi:hypothetical protein
MPEGMEDQYIDYIDALIGQYGTGHPALMDEIETIRNNPKLLKTYNEHRAFLISNFSHARSISNEAKAELFGPDLSEPAPPEVAREHKPPSAVATPRTFTTVPGAESWNEVSMRFLELDRVVVSVKGKNKPILGFSELPGFMDKRTKTPNELWALLNQIAIDDGLFKLKSGEILTAKKQLLKRLQKELRSIFGLREQPFKPYNRKDRSRQARFSLMPKPL